MATTNPPRPITGKRALELADQDECGRNAVAEVQRQSGERSESVEGSGAAHREQVEEEADRGGEYYRIDWNSESGVDFGKGVRERETAVLGEGPRRCQR